MIPCVNNKNTKPIKLAYHANIKASRKSVKIYCHRDRTSISQRTSCNKGYIAGAAIYHQRNIIDPFLCHYSFNLKGISDCKCCNCWSIYLLSSVAFLSPFLFVLFCFVQSSSFPFFFFFLNYCFVSFSLSCSFLLEGKVLQLCSNRNFGHLPVGWVSYLILGKEPS